MRISNESATLSLVRSLTGGTEGFRFVSIFFKNSIFFFEVWPEKIKSSGC